MSTTTMTGINTAQHIVQSLNSPVRADEDNEDNLIDPDAVDELREIETRMVRQVHGERSLSLVAGLFFPSAKSEAGSGSWEWNETNTDSPINISSLFPSNKSETDDSSPKFSRSNSDSIMSIFLPATSPVDSPINNEITLRSRSIPLYSIMSIFPPAPSPVDSPENTEITLRSRSIPSYSIMSIFSPARSEISSPDNYLPNGLRVLDWPGFPSSSLPSNFRPPKPVVLNIPKSQLILPKLLKRIPCKSLTYMNFQSCQYIRELPDLSISTPNIKQLNLRECIKLVKVHDSVGCLDKLESLDLTGCVELKILPSYITMKSLKFLILYNCKKVERFPDIAKEMGNLKFLSLAYTAIRELPSSFRNLSGLERLDVGSYSYTCHLPSSIYELPHLHKLFIYGSVQFPEDVEIRTQALCNSYGGFSKYGFLKLNFLKKFTSYFHLSKKSLLSRSKNLNLEDNIMRFNGLRYLLIEDPKSLKEIPELPESIRSVYALNCISLNPQSIRNLFDQFGRILDFPPNMICSGVKRNILVDSHSHQIDYSSQLSISKFILIEKELHPTLDEHLIDFGERYSIVVPEKKIPEWFNHQSIESSISFRIGPEFSTFAFCIAFHLVSLKDSYANLRDDMLNWICVVNISINGQEQPFMQPQIFQRLRCDHLWFCGVPHGQLQQKFGDLMQGDQNEVEFSCKISHWTSKLGKFAPVIARMGVHVECICPPQNSIIIHNNSENVDNNSENVDDNSDNTELAPLLDPVSTDSDAG